MATTEEQDRIARFRRLSTESDTVPPDVTETILPPGSVDFMQSSVPVVRVVFPEKAFFAFDSATPLPQSAKILDVIAENMKHDVPDAALTVLGHTDAIGTDSYNIDLSRRRAQAVMDALIARGVRPSQLTEVAIGKRLPIAPNDTDEGRALNRRVEFLVSPALSANLAVIQQYVVPASYLKTPDTDTVGKAHLSTVNAAPVDYASVFTAAPEANVTKRTGQSPLKLSELGELKLSPVSTQQIALNTPSNNHAESAQVANVKLAPTMQVKPVHLVSPDSVKLRELNNNTVTY